MKGFPQISSLALLLLCAFAVLLSPAMGRSGQSYVKVQTVDRGYFIVTSGLDTGDWLGREVYEAELINIVESYIGRDRWFGLPKLFQPRPYLIESAISILTEIRNPDVKGLCIQLLDDPDFGKRAPGCLAEFGDLNMSPHIVKAMRQSDSGDFVYLSALIQLKDRRALPLLIDKFDVAYMQVWTARNVLESIELLSGEKFIDSYTSNWNSRSSARDLHDKLMDWWQTYSVKHSIEGF